MYTQNDYLSILWPPLTAHKIFWENRNNPHVYEYDPTDDGPEVEIIREFLFQDLINTVFK